MDERRTFDAIQAFVRKWEGGLSNHPADAGGITNFGVSLRFLKDTAKTAPAVMTRLRLYPTEDCVRNLTKEQAAEIFREMFWLKTKIYRLPTLCAMATYDAAVNCGPGNGVRFLQRWLKGHVDGGIAVDGLIGPITINAATPRDQDAALGAIQKRCDYYQNIVNNKPSQKVFLKGWLNRAGALKNFIQNNDLYMG